MIELVITKLDFSIRHIFIVTRHIWRSNLQMGILAAQKPREGLFAFEGSVNQTMSTLDGTMAPKSTWKITAVAPKYAFGPAIL